MADIDCEKARALLIQEIAHALAVAADPEDQDAAPPGPDEALELVRAFLEIRNRSTRLVTVRVLRELVRRDTPARRA